MNIQDFNKGKVVDDILLFKKRQTRFETEMTFGLTFSWKPYKVSYERSKDKASFVTNNLTRCWRHDVDLQWHQRTFELMISGNHCVCQKSIHCTHIQGLIFINDIITFSSGVFSVILNCARKSRLQSLNNIFL